MTLYVSANSWAGLIGIPRRPTSVPNPRADRGQRLQGRPETAPTMSRTRHLDTHRMFQLKLETLYGVQIKLHRKYPVKSTVKNCSELTKESTKYSCTVSKPISDGVRSSENIDIHFVPVTSKSSTINRLDRSLEKTLSCKAIRANSAPPCPRPSERRMATYSQPVFWKTRENNRAYSGSKPSLRTLLYNPWTERATRPCNDCPYKCRGCFKAFLASDDFVRRLTEMQSTKP